MKTRIFYLTLLLEFIHLILSAQSDERFIRILGNSKRTFNYEKIAIRFSINEIVRDDYHKIPARSIKENKESLELDLNKLGIDCTKNMIIDFPSGGNYYNNYKENYILYVENEEIAKQVLALNEIGVQFERVSYDYGEYKELDDKELSLEAINNARKKAEEITKEIGKKVGRILNIEDKSSGNLNMPTNYTGSKYTAVYWVSVTFELLD